MKNEFYLNSILIMIVWLHKQYIYFFQVKICQADYILVN